MKFSQPCSFGAADLRSACAASQQARQRIARTAPATSLNGDQRHNSASTAPRSPSVGQMLFTISDCDERIVNAHQPRKHFVTPPLRVKAMASNDGPAAEMVERQKENAWAPEPPRGTDSIHVLRGGGSTQCRNLPILRGTNKSAKETSSCPEEWGMPSVRRADDVRLSCRRYACPVCVANGAVFPRMRRK